MAGVPGFEPGLSVLETDVLTVDTIPLRVIANCRFPIANFHHLSVPRIGNRQLEMPLLRFLVISVLATTAAEFAELQPVGRRLLVLGRNVVATLTNAALKHNVISWHCRKSYSTTSETVPAPTVRPPSRIAKRNPFSIAMGAINSISIATLSPGITISTPAGRCATPVTSVVRK
jgi:hypothetical protein